METLWGLIISWIPPIILLVLWVYFMKSMKMSKHGILVERQFQHMERVENLLERIAKSLECDR